LYLRIAEFVSSPRALDENCKCDEVFAYYIVKVAKVAKPEFFMKVLKFITLFRECLNNTNRDKMKPKNGSQASNDYSEVFNPEDVPDISNEYVTEYLGTEHNLFDFGREEAIDLTQNFCQWLYDNNFTCSKLSLISNY